MTTLEAAGLPQTPPHISRRSRRVDARAVMGIFLLLFATGGSISFWAASTDSQPVLAAVRDLPVGATLGLGDLSVTYLRADSAIAEQLIPAEEMSHVVGKQLAEATHREQLLTKAHISGRPPLRSGQQAFTIAIKPETAAGGRLRSGDTVSVLWTTNKGRPDSLTTVVLPRATVFEVGYDERSALFTSSTQDGQGGRAVSPGLVVSLTLMVTREEAIDLAQAKWNGELDVALLPAERP
jgi:Flp pilus assembly protein CpaB